jgi:hypothetical protein
MTVDEGIATQVQQGSRSSWSVRDLHTAYMEQGQPELTRTRAGFEKEHGRIEEAYYATGTSATVVAVERRGWYRLKVAYDASHANVTFAEVVRSALMQERQSAPLLRKKARQVLVLSLYTVIAYLFNTLDSVLNNPNLVGAGQERYVTEAARSANRDLTRIRANLEGALKRSALAWYLLGLVPGCLVAGLLILLVWRLPFSISKSGGADVKNQLVICLAFGGVGAVVSVMSRVTRRQQVDVDILQGRPLTIAAGGFRVLIGAIFGLILYVIVTGGLLPLQTASKDEGLFFAGLAFLAGFSERWAQDSIVQSVPLGQKERSTQNGSGTNGHGPPKK